MTVAAAAIRPHRLPTPDSEPPYDDPGPVPIRGLAPGAPAVASPLFPPVQPVPRPALRVVPDPPLESPAPNAGLPAVKAWAETVAMVIAQILSGERPPGPFRQSVPPEIYDLLSRRAALAAQGPRRRAALRAVHVCCPARGIAEVATVVHGLARPRALAFRLEARRTRWVCTALELG